MGKQAREERRGRQRARRRAGPAAEVAKRAEAGLETLVTGLADFALLNGRRVLHFDPQGFGAFRANVIERGYRWPAWCYLPAALVGAALGEEVAIDANPALLSPSTMLAHVIASWLPGRIAVRFDEDLAQALVATPVEGAVPVEVLRRLPAWGLTWTARHWARAQVSSSRLMPARSNIPMVPPPLTLTSCFWP